MLEKNMYTDMWSACLCICIYVWVCVYVCMCPSNFSATITNGASVAQISLAKMDTPTTCVRALHQSTFR